MPDICGDNRFKIIASAKQRLIEATNIESRPEEMAVIDSILFRMWQMGWLPGCERDERTCHAVIVDSGAAAICSACGTIIEKPETRFVLTLWNHSKFMNYCPTCGAKVVE